MLVQDITGQTFNRWTVIKRVENNKQGDAMWLCECSCDAHTQKIVKGSALKSGHSKSCGCLKKEKAAIQGANNSVDLTGQKFEHLTVLEKAYSKDHKVFWKCECDCENKTIVYIPTGHLRSGHTKSCGCITKNDLKGQQFGLLTAIRPTGLRAEDGSVIWECICGCESKNKVFKSSTDLKSGKAFSCGCIGPASKGEEKIASILTQYNIPFIREKFLEDCYFSDSHKNPRFDFFVNNSYFIEYDGEQHFNYREKGFFSEENWNKIVLHDKEKNEFCKNLNIPLIRIPYTHFEEIEINDLLLETSEFIIK